MAENPALPEGARLDIGFAVLRATASAPTTTPLLVLVGGPGQAATEAGVAIAQVLSKVRQERDVVLIDQRGTGRSNPLSCAAEDVPPIEQFGREPSIEELETCARQLQADTTQYTTLDALPDFEAVRRSLGYPRWNLWGGSYGTRVALAYAKYHPDSVERLVLDGPAPTDIELPLHFGEDARSSMDKLQALCEHQPPCGRNFGNVTDLIEGVSARLARGTSVDVEVTHPSRGTLERVTVTESGFLGGVRSLLYSTELSALLPFAVARIQDQDDWGPLVTTAVSLGELMQERSSHLGMYLSVVCAEDVPRITDADLAALGEQKPFGSRFVEQAKFWCAHWRAKQMPEDYFEPVTATHPTLILTGARDPATPPRWGALVEQRMPHSVHVSVSEASHGVTPLGCAPQVIADFFSSTDPLSVATGCLSDVKAPPLFTRATGP